MKNSCVIQGNLEQKLSGSISASPSKSQSLRAILFATLANGESKISNVLLSPDVQSMITACEELGARIKFINNNCLSVIGTAGKLQQPRDIINAGNSGIVFRFIASIAGLLDNYTVITGDESIRNNRPIKPLLDGLRGLGVFAESMLGNDKAPIIIKGPMLFNNTELEGYDSQPVSGLIIAAILNSSDTTIIVKNPGEKPWLDLTLAWLDKFNIKYIREDYNKLIISGNNKIKAFEYFVPSDLSSIAFPVAAALVTNSNIIINNVDLSDKQGDKLLLDLFSKMGANIEYDFATKILSVYKHNGLVNINSNINNFIDAINILAVVACYAKGTARISGAEVARYKECDRIKAVYTELSKMGANIIERKDGLDVSQSNLVASTELETYKDHRMVMALFVAALGAKGKSKILDIAPVSKSYPSFFEHMKALGCDFYVIS